jgi:AraC-like DNA-binding protein
MTAFYIAGIGIALFIEFLLVSKKNKSGSDKVLTIWMFVILVHLFVFYLYFTGDVVIFPFLLGVEHPLPLLHGIFLYLYVASLTRQLPHKRWTLAFHAVPITLAYAYLASFFVLPAEQKMEVYRNQGAGYEVFLLLKTYAIMCSGLFYVSWSVLLLRRHAGNIRDQFSDVEKINLRWLQFLTLGLGAIWFLVLFAGNDTLIYAGVVVFVFLIGFFGIRQANIFAHTRLTPADVDTKEKYQKSGLTDKASHELHQQLKHVMADDAVYKNSELSIDDLATKLGVHPNHLSQVINQKGNKNFYDFVNTYRVEEFKRLIALQKNRQFTLLSLAYDCGFSSKTSFNRCFKKATGQTPSEYTAALAQK